MYVLYIANKNYSSWSLRPWVLMHERGIAFEERLVPFETGPNPTAFLAFSPTGKVPCLIDGDTRVWDSLAIIEYLAERHQQIWPDSQLARTWARCATAEMHSGFSTLRNVCGMNCGIRVHHEKPNALLERELTRLEALWNEGLERFGGPFLAGSYFTAVDAFFAPVAFRLQTYGLTLGTAAASYAARLLQLASMRHWYADALSETWRDPEHEAELRHRKLLADLRTPA
jgi:glutathione S-transferase